MTQIDPSLAELLFSTPRCPACDHPERNPLGPIRYGSNAIVADQDASDLAARLGRIELVECASCGFRWTDPRYPMDLVLDLYRKNDQPHWENAGRDWEAHLRLLSPYLWKGAAVLDVGCYTGNFLHRLGPDYERHGIEPIPYAAQLSRDRGIRVHEGTLQDAPYGPGSFDIITLWDVAEHLHEPHEVLTQLAGWLRPGGVIALETGNVECWYSRYMGSDWWYVSILEHCSFYTEESFRRLFGRSGLTMKSCDRTYHHSVSLPFTMKQLAKSWLYRTLSRAEQRGSRLPLKPLSSRILHKRPPTAFVRDHLVLVAQRAQ